MLKRTLSVILAFLLMVTAVIIVRGILVPDRQIAVKPAELLPVDQTHAAQNLSRALQFKTISYQDPAQFPAAEFDAFRAFLVEAFPKVHATLKREIINGHGMLYTWQGSDAGLQPILFLAHYDVVPVEPGTESDWTHPPFSGEIADGSVWGRGAIDFKCGVIGTLEAVEALLQQGFQPARTICLAYGFDEEVGGEKGAAKIAAALKERGIKVAFSLDEGLAIAQGILPGVAQPVALIGLAEKGYVNLELSVEGKGGHSSNPPPQTSIGILSAAIARLEQHPMPARLEGPIRSMLEDTAPHMSFPLRTVMANLWIFSGLVKRVLAADPAPNAAIRTTTAPTIFHSGTKENVLPIKASAIVNFRILPGDTVQSVIDHAKQAVHDDRVKIAILEGHESTEPSPVSDINAEGYRMIAQSVRETRPDAIVTPGLTLGGTDSKNYVGVADNLYRLQPMLFTMADLGLIHSTNEHINIENYVRGVQTYAQIMRNAAGKK